MSVTEPELVESWALLGQDNDYVLGADVIKIEPPDGAPTRKVAPFKCHGASVADLRGLANIRRKY